MNLLICNILFIWGLNISGLFFSQLLSMVCDKNWMAFSFYVLVFFLGFSWRV